MIELGQLERRHDDFRQRHTRVIVISVEDLDDANQTQTDFPDLLVLSDPEHSLSDAAALIHPHAGPGGSDINAPTTFLVDRHGTVRWLYRSPTVLARLSPDEVLQAIDIHMR
jgi:alkyl hydroperoxide reductase subunit AhpC